MEQEFHRAPGLSRIVAGVLAGLLFATPQAALAGPKEEAQAHFDRAAELYAKEDYEAATREFALAYAKDPRVDIMFAWAQAERLGGDLVEAHRLYGRLLERDDLSPQQREAIEGLQAEVRADAEAQGINVDGAPPEPEPEPEPEAEPEPAPVPADSGPQMDEKGRRTGLILVGAGAGATVLGAGLVVGGAILDLRVESASTYQEFGDRYDAGSGRGKGAVPLYAAGGVVGGVGLALIVAGVVKVARASSGKSSSTALLRASRGGFSIRF